MWDSKGSEWVSLDQDVSPSRLEMNLQRAAAESPAAESPAAESPAADSPAAESRAAESPAAESPAAESRHDEAWQGQVSSTTRSKAGIWARVVLAHNYTGP